MEIGIERNSLERQYQIAHRNALDKQFQNILLGGGKNISQHIMSDTMDALFFLFEVYRHLDEEISNLYFKYNDPKPLFGLEPDVFYSSYEGVEDDAVAPAEVIYKNPHDKLFAKIKSKFPDGLLKAKAGDITLQIDDDIFSPDQEEPGEFFHVVPAGGNEDTSIPLYTVYPQDATITEHVHKIIQNQRTALCSLFTDVEQELAQHIAHYNSIQQVTQKSGFIGIYRTLHPFSNGSVGVTFKQQEYLSKLIKKNQGLTAEEKEAMTRIIQYMTLGEASLIIDRLVRENREAAQVTLGKLFGESQSFDNSNNTRDEFRDTGPDLPF